MAAPKKIVVTKKVSGPSVEADRWGTVQINVTVRKTTTIVKGVKKVTRKITDIGGTFSYHTDRSLYIMQQSLPQLRQQALQSLSANVEHHLGRDLHEPGVHRLAAAGARDGQQGLSHPVTAARPACAASSTSWACR